jgi:S1-C subfamily serine protease
MDRRPHSGSEGKHSTGMIAAFAVVFLLIVGVAAYSVGRYSSGQSAGQAPGAHPAPTATRWVAAQRTAKPTGFAALYRDDSSGVLRIETNTCANTGEGTGFLLSSGYVATVAHVVTGAVSVSITGNGETSAGTVVGYDAGQDLALLRPSSSFTGHAFRWAHQDPAVGDQVAAIGYPLNQLESLTVGTVSGLDRSVPVEGTMRTGLIC